MTRTPNNPPHNARRYLGPAGPLGFHASIAGGPANAPAHARRLGARAMQIFTRSPRMWRAAPISRDGAAAFRAEVARLELTAVVAHAIYLLNLASSDDALWRRSIDAFVDEIERCALLGIDRIVIHPGSRGEQTVVRGLRRVLRALTEVTRRTRQTGVKVLLETTAGAGASLGARIDELAWLIDRHPQPERLGLCLDSCHLFAAGYPLHEPDGLDRLLAEIDDAVGTTKIECLHLNDSKGEFASRVDRHARLGQGHIGEDFFRRLMREPRLFGVPKLLEVPGGDEAFAGDLRLLARLAARQ